MKHLWEWPLSMGEQAGCWCNPFVGSGDFIDGLVFHRPFPGYVFVEYGEHGPKTILQVENEESFWRSMKERCPKGQTGTIGARPRRNPLLSP